MEIARCEHFQSPDYCPQRFAFGGGTADSIHVQIKDFIESEEIGMVFKRRYSREDSTLFAWLSDIVKSTKRRSADRCRLSCRLRSKSPGVEPERFGIPAQK